MNPRQTLKQLLQRDKFSSPPAVSTAFPPGWSRKLGFEAAYLSGGAVARSMGIPDIGLVTMSESIERAVRSFRWLTSR